MGLYIYILLNPLSWRSILRRGLEANSIDIRTEFVCPNPLLLVQVGRLQGIILRPTCLASHIGAAEISEFIGKVFMSGRSDQAQSLHKVSYAA